MLTLSPVTGTIGAEVGGLELGSEIDEVDHELLGTALVEHKVLFFRHQTGLTPDAQLNFARRFGNLDPMAFPLEGYTEIMELKGEGTNEQLSESWHTDGSFMESPPIATLLRAIDVPAHGRDTVWADMCAAYQGLSADVQRFVDGLRARHDVLKMASRSGRFDTQALRQRYPIVEHPIVRIHPITGAKALYVNQLYTTEIVGLRADESWHLLELLFAQTRYPDYHVRFRWRPGDLAMWDNRTTQHYIVHDRAYPRVMHRVSISGTNPVSKLEASMHANALG
jgi:taurine dioxygenase